MRNIYVTDRYCVMRMNCFDEAAFTSTIRYFRGRAFDSSICAQSVARTNLQIAFAGALVERRAR